MSNKGMPEKIWAGEDGEWSKTDDFYGIYATYIRADIVEELVRLAKERDGGAHDPDCKIGNVWSNMPMCNCGHVALTDILSRINAIMEGK